MYESQNLCPIQMVVPIYHLLPEATLTILSTVGGPHNNIVVVRIELLSS